MEKRESETKEKQRLADLKQKEEEEIVKKIAEEKRIVADKKYQQWLLENNYDETTYRIADD